MPNTVKPDSMSSPSFLQTFALYRRRVAVIVGSCIVALIALSYLLPHNFQAVATALPPEQSGTGGMISALLSNSIAADLLKGGSENPTLDLFKTIVESRNVAEEVAKDPKIHKFCAQFDTSEDAIVGRLNGAVEGEALRTGMFTVTVNVKTGWAPSSSQEEQTRTMAPYIGNKFMQELDRFNRERLMTSAHNTRVFIEKEYLARMAQLDSSYKRLQAFQEENKAISLPDQLAATVTAAAKLVGEIQQMETQLAVEEQDLTENAQRVQMLRSTIDAAKQQLQKYDDGGAGEYVLALKQVPALTREFASYFREAKVLEQVTAFLRQQLEQERISEQRDLPSLQVLDPAKAPRQRSSPKRSIMGLLGLVIGSLVATVYLRVRMVADDIKVNPQAHVRFIRFLDVLRGREPLAAGAESIPTIEEKQAA